jgi:hypothetical protein
MEIIKEIIEFVQKGSPLIAADPTIAIGLIAVGFGVAWWLKSNWDTAQIKGAKAEVGALNARLLLAADREQAVKDARDELTKKVEELKDNIVAGASKDVLAPFTVKVDTALDVLMSANNKLETSLVTIGGKPIQYEERGDLLVIQDPDGGPAIVVPKRRDLVS